MIAQVQSVRNGDGEDVKSGAATANFVSYLGYRVGVVTVVDELGLRVRCDTEICEIEVDREEMETFFPTEGPSGTISNFSFEYAEVMWAITCEIGLQNRSCSLSLSFSLNHAGAQQATSKIQHLRSVQRQFPSSPFTPCCISKAAARESIFSHKGGKQWLRTP